MRIKFTMKPAIEGDLKEAGLGDIESVPSVSVSLSVRNQVASLPGIIDTAASISLADELWFRRTFNDSRLRVREFSSISSMGGQFARVPVYLMSLAIVASSGKRIELGRVPIALVALNRPVLIVGRRGVLERLALKLDFPRRIITVDYQRSHQEMYPTLSGQLPRFAAIGEMLGSGDRKQAAVELAWEVERYLDRVLQRYGVATEVQVGRSSMMARFKALQTKADIEIPAPIVDRVVSTRNALVHGTKATRLTYATFFRDAEAVLAILCAATKDEMPWESTTRLEVEALLDEAEWDFVNGCVQIRTGFEELHQEHVMETYNSYEDLLHGLDQAASEVWYANVPFDDGEAVFDLEASQLVREVVEARARTELGRLGWLKVG